MSNQKYRDQIADLILKDSDDQDLVVTSILKCNGRDYLFEVGEDKPDGARYRVRIEIKPIPLTIHA